MKTCTKHNKIDDTIIVYDDYVCPICIEEEENNKLSEIIETQNERINVLNKENSRLCSAIEDLEQANILLQAAINKFGDLDIVDDINDGR